MKDKLIFFSLLLIMSCTVKKDNLMYDGNLDFWTKDFSEIELVMSYIMDTKDYRQLKKINAKEKSQYLDDYWFALDPDRGTDENELFEELRVRVLESKDLFSGIDGGLLSDRAQIYIIYGPPHDEFKTSSYNNNNIEILVWKYKSGYEFNFIIDSFGRYKLINN
tara:strand:+ start:4545 stop:5036 length:492 start_codon:yes stop_codon:yes gene_type:complete